VAADCKPAMTSGVTTLVSDWNDVGAAVDYVLTLRHGTKLNLVGCRRVVPLGGLGAQHPDKVNKLVLLAPLTGAVRPSAPRRAATRRAVRRFNVQTMRIW